MADEKTCSFCGAVDGQTHLIVKGVMNGKAEVVPTHDEVKDQQHQTEVEVNFNMQFDATTYEIQRVRVALAVSFLPKQVLSCETCDRLILKISNYDKK